MSDPNAESRTDVSMPIPGISDGVKGAWLLDVVDEGLITISDDIAAACAASAHRCPQPFFRQHQSNII
jgi:hypothetical protein